MTSNSRFQICQLFLVKDYENQVHELSTTVYQIRGHIKGKTLLPLPRNAAHIQEEEKRVNNVFVLHQNKGAVYLVEYGNSLLIIPSPGMYQEIPSSSRPISIDSVKINPSLLMRENGPCGRAFLLLNRHHVLPNTK